MSSESFSGNSERINPFEFEALEFLEKFKKHKKEVRESARKNKI